MCDGLEAALVLSKICAEVIHGSSEIGSISVVGMTDNKSLVDAAYSSKLLEDRRLIIDMAIIRQMINRDEIQLEWVQAKDQVSDVLTKMGVSGVKVRQVMGEGRL